MNSKLKLWSLCFYLFISSSVLHAAITVGIPFFKPPFVLSPAQGFDVDLIHLICKKITEHCNLIPMNFNNFFTALQTKKIDLAMGVVIIPSRREQGFAFSMPYLVTKGQFLLLKNSPIKSIDKLKKLTVGVIKAQEDGGAFYNYLTVTYPKFTIIQYNDSEDLITSLDNGNIDTGFMYKQTVDYWIQNGGAQFQQLGKPVTIGEGTAIMALSTNNSLINRINQTLNTLENNQTYLTLYSTYFLKD